MGHAASGPVYMGSIALTDLMSVKYQNLKPLH